MLMRAVDCYLAVRRAAGYELTVPDYRIRSMNCVAHTRGAAAYMTPHRWHTRPERRGRHESPGGRAAG